MQVQKNLWEHLQSLKKYDFIKRVWQSCTRLFCYFIADVLKKQINYVIICPCILRETGEIPVRARRREMKICFSYSKPQSKKMSLSYA